MHVKFSPQSCGKQQHFAQGTKVDLDIANARAEVEVDAAGSKLWIATDPSERFKSIAGVQTESKLTGPSHRSHDANARGLPPARSSRSFRNVVNLGKAVDVD